MQKYQIDDRLLALVRATGRASSRELYDELVKLDGFPGHPRTVYDRLIALVAVGTLKRVGSGTALTFALATGDADTAAAQSSRKGHMQAEQLDNAIVALVRKHDKPIGTKTLHHELRRRGVPSYSHRSVSGHLHKLVERGVLRQHGSSRWMTYSIAPAARGNGLSAEQTVIRHMRRVDERELAAELVDKVEQRAHVVPRDVDALDKLAQHDDALDETLDEWRDRVDREVEQQQLAEQQRDALERAFAPAAAAAAPAASSIVEQHTPRRAIDDAVDNVLKRLLPTLRAAIRDELTAQVEKAYDDADAALELADERQQQLLAQRAKLRALLDDDR